MPTSTRLVNYLSFLELEQAGWDNLTSRQQSNEQTRCIIPTYRTNLT